ncbi:hypothetical protein FJV76_30395 [Mesorhizobium sp. WSM4303]|uniref:hypothetical protein n=1 Tax=unclassified Mesorhizobium TaxID=325217 RepID=UPI00115C5086|nr:MULTISPECIES: hypothetical protein [unclassified Mesorhizobium]TRC89349.1 hypothetical protein FJV77_29695 [Mesorhizobium sp. WSM4306]TRC94613.1 hypothetical protein FJV76_30395 [Mesorhizobium sp. WSM4303]
MAGPSFGDCHGWARIIGHIPLLMPSRYWSLTARRILSLFTADFDAVNEAIARISFCDDVVILSGGRMKKQAPFGALVSLSIDELYQHEPFD